MGNTNKHLQEEALKNGHPNFNDAKIVTDQNRKFIEAKFKVQNKEYEEWNKRVMQGNQINPEYLMLPEKANFKDDAGLCGNTGTLTVNNLLSRTNMPTIPTSSQNSSRIAKKKEGSLKNRNSGTYSMLSQLPKGISESRVTKLEISNLKISLLMQRDKSKSQTCFPGLMSYPVIKKP